MFEKRLEELLKSIIGEYVDNIDTEHLYVSLWNGLLTLYDIKLKTDLCTKLNIPFDLKLGIIKDLKLEVPWNKLASSPVVLKLD